MGGFRKLGVPKGSFQGILSGYYKGSSKGLYKGLEFPKIRGALFWGPYNKDQTIEGTIVGSPPFSETPRYCCDDYSSNRFQAGQG